MNKLTGYETFCLFIALKNHFTQKSYDFFKYNGKVHIGKETYLTRKDKFVFEMIAKKFNRDDAINLMVSNFIADRPYAVDFIHDDGVEAYTQHKKVLESLTYTFMNEMEKALLYVSDPKQLFQRADNDYPTILNLYYQQEISLQTLVILSHFVPFVDKFDVKLKGDYIWDTISTRIKKYSPFLLRQIDRKKFKEMLKERLNGHIYT